MARHRRLEKGQRGFTMVEIAISLAVVAFALVAIIGVLPRGLNAQRDNRTETIINLDAEYWMDALCNSAQGTNQLVDYVKKIEIYDVSNDKVVTTYTYGPKSQSTYSNDREIIGLLTQPVDRSFRIYADVLALNGAAIEKTGPSSELGFSYRMYVDIQDARDVSPTNAPGDDWYKLQGNLHNVRLDFAWPLVNNRVGNGRQTYRNVAQGLLQPDPADGRLFFIIR